MANFTPLPLYPQCRNPRYPLDRMLGGPTAGLDAVEKRKILHCWEWNPGHPARNPSPYRLSCPRLPKILRWCYFVFYEDSLEEIFLSSIYSVTTLGCFLLSRHDTNCCYPEMRIKEDAYVTHTQLHVSQVDGFPFLANCAKHVYML
jgi:hypothetical protein